MAAVISSPERGEDTDRTAAADRQIMSPEHRERDEEADHEEPGADDQRSRLEHGIRRVGTPHLPHSTCTTLFASAFIVRASRSTS